MDNEELVYWLRLSLISGLGSIKIQQLLKYFTSPKGIIEASSDEIENVLNTKWANKIKNFKWQEKVAKQLKLIEEYQVEILTLTDSNYPPLLKQIYDPPPLLFIRGNLTEADHKAIAIVGTRQSSKAGRLFAKKLAYELSEYGITIISGLARGIDSSAHRGTLDNPFGRTIAVLGCGVNIIYPADNESLMHDIMKNGAVISELPLGMKPLWKNFPARNRIISGLSLGTIIIEAGMKSGAMITARCALEQNRDVFAVPGSVHLHNSQGTNYLIQNGAKLVQETRDVIEEIEIQFNFTPTTSPKLHKKLPPLNPNEEKVYSTLSNTTPIHIDDLALKTELSITELLTSLTQLELKNLIQQLSGKMFIRLE